MFYRQQINNNIFVSQLGFGVNSQNFTLIQIEVMGPNK